MSHALIGRPTIRVLLVALLGAVWALPTPSVRAQEDPVQKLSKPGPLTATLSNVAKIEVPAGYRFIDKANIKKFNDLTQNLTSPREVGAIIPQDDQWYIIFSYNDEGYVKDDEKDQLDADAILKHMKENDEPSNQERKRLNMPPLHTVGWEKPPFFDDKTKNLTWGLKVQSEGRVSINYEARILGRGGHMSATLVCGPDQLASKVPIFDSLLGGYTYTEGQKYSDWKAGDKVAAVGLTGLVVGGVGVLAAKSGFLAKFIKPIIAAIVIFFGAIGTFFKKLFGRGGSSSASTEETTGA